MSIAVAMVTALAVPNASEGAVVRYASPSGSGIECSESKPCDLRTAVEHITAPPDSEVVLMSGRYDLGAAPLEVDPGFDVRGLTRAPEVVIESSVAAPEAAIHLNRPGGTIGGGGSATELRDLTVVQQGTGSAILAESAALTRVIAVARSNGAPLCRMSGSIGRIYDSVCGGPRDVAVELNRIYAHLLNVTAVSQAPGGTGVSVVDLGPPEFEHSFIDINQSIVWGEGSDASIRYDEAADVKPSVGFHLSNLDSLTVNGAPTAIPDQEIQTAPPLFADPASQDFREAPGSPTVDAGLDVHPPLDHAKDVEGEARLQGGEVDIGADETSIGPQAVPQTSIASEPPNRLRGKRARYEFKIRSAGTAFECDLDRQGFINCRSPWTLRGLDPGRHRFAVRTVDSDGQVDPTPAIDRFRVLRRG